MPGFFERIKEKMQTTESNETGGAEAEEGYVELDTEAEETKSKITVRPFILKDFEDISGILDSLREGSTIALINIKPLKDKDLVELKRAINKLKKTTDAIEGEIAGFGEDYIVVAPSFAQIYRGSGDTKEIQGEAVPPQAPTPQAGEPVAPQPEGPKVETY